MNRVAFPTLCALVLALQAGCGAEPESSSGTPSPLQGLQPIPFTGIVDPAAGRMQLVAAPQAALAITPEDKDGSLATVTTSTAQLYGTMGWLALGGGTYPATCDPTAPQLMLSSVEIWSGFTEQLRNVYARITTVSQPGDTFCNSDPVGSFGASLNPNLGLIRYQPLDAGTNANSLIRRSVQWAMNLTSASSFSFSGELWAEVIPQPPALNAPTIPADHALHTGSTFRTTLRVNFAWTPDALANGSNPEGFVVPRPTSNGTEVTIYRCGAAAAAYDPANCLTLNYGPTVRNGTTQSRTLNAGFWYQWKARAGFNLPGSGTRTLGTLYNTQYFSVVAP